MMMDDDDLLFPQGIFQKAEAMYYKGDFELALVFYHRGHKLRPELQEFRLGIQKAQEAIENSVGSKYRLGQAKRQASRECKCSAISILCVRRC